MKPILGLFLIFFSLNALAGSNAALQLRAVVSPAVKVEVKIENRRPRAWVTTNHRNQRVIPSFITQKSSNVYLVSVTHP